MKSCKKLSAHRATTLVANLENDEPTASPSNDAVYNTHPDVVEENLHIAIRPLHDSNINIPSPHAPQVHAAAPGDGDLSGHSLIIHRPNIEQDHAVYNPFGFTFTPLGRPYRVTLGRVLITSHAMKKSQSYTAIVPYPSLSPTKVGDTKPQMTSHYWDMLPHTTENININSPGESVYDVTPLDSNV